MKYYHNIIAILHKWIRTKNSTWPHAFLVNDTETLLEELIKERNEKVPDVVYVLCKNVIKRGKINSTETSCAYLDEKDAEENRVILQNMANDNRDNIIWSIHMVTLIPKLYIIQKNIITALGLGRSFTLHGV